MEKTEDIIWTPRNKAHMCDRVYHGNQPVGFVKAKTRQDYMTASEYAEALYGKPVKKIVFMDGAEVEEPDTVT